MKKNLSNTILTQIKQQGISPISLWKFTLKKSIIWTAFILSVLLGAIGIGEVFYISHIYAVDLWSMTWLPFVSDIFWALIVFWLLLVLVFLYLAYIYFRHTGRGYLYRFYEVFIVSLVLSTAIAYALQYSSIMAYIDDAIQYTVPSYRDIVQSDDRVWSQPASGTLAALVVDTSIDGYLIVEDEHSSLWLVDVTGLDTSSISVGHRIRIRGGLIYDSGFSDDFTADSVLVIPK